LDFENLKPVVAGSACHRLLLLLLLLLLLQRCKLLV
jgi:hypothetical protein